MPLIFLSHSGRNTAAARALRDRILATPAAQDAGLRVWLDVVDLQEGRPWKTQIEEVIALEATAFVVLVDTGGVQTWVAAETDAALSRAVADPGFRFIPILAADAGSADLSPFARRYHALRGDPLTDADALQRLIAAALGAEADAGRPVLTDDPFPGLNAMTEHWADRFFGRATETAEVIAQLRANPMIAIVADSGAGKSSLAMAGVGMAWRGGALEADVAHKPPPRNWNTITFRPLGHPIREFAKAIRNDFARRGVAADAQLDILEKLGSGKAADVLHLLSVGLPEGETRTLIIVDQAEELFTQTTDPERRSEILQLLAALADEGKDGAECRVLFTLRADFQNQLQQCPETAAFLGTLDDGANRFRLKRLSDDGVRAMVLRPLAMAGFRDDTQADELADRIVADLTADEGDLALAQFALSEAWNTRGPRDALIEGYRSVDGVAGALAHTAERLMETDAFVQEHEARIIPLFFRLIRLDAQAFRIARRVAPRDEFDDTDWRLISLFASREGGRLVRTTEDFAEITHEKLITQWGRLHDAVRQNDVGLRTLNRLIMAATAWREGGRARKYLTSLADEDAFQTLARAQPDWISELEQDFLGWTRRTHWQNRALRLTGIAAIAASLFAAIFFFQAGREARNEALQALDQAEQAEITAVAVLANATGEAEPLKAIKLALAAWPQSRSATAFRPPGSQILEALGKAVPLQRLLVQADVGSQVTSVAFSRDGQRLLSGGRDGTLRLWDARTGAQIGEPLRGHESVVTSVAFSPDGQRLLSGGEDGTLRLWDAQTGAQIGEPLRGHEDEVNSVAFSPDGTRLLSGGDDRTLRLWDAQTGAQIGAPLTGHERWVLSVAVSPDGTRLLSGSFDGTLRLWDAQTGAQIGAPLRGHGGMVHSVAFSPDGTRLLSGGTDGTLRLWDAQTGAQIGEPLTGHEGWVNSVAFSPDGTRLLSGGDDRTLRLWDAQTGAQIGAPLRGHQGWVGGVAFSPDSTRLLSGGFDGTLRLWDAPTGAQIGEPLRGHEGWVNSVAFSPDGQRLLSGGTDDTLRLWDARTGAQIGEPLRGHEGVVTSVAFAPDGQRLLSGSSDGTLRLWDARTGAQIGEPLRGHERLALSVAFSPDGQRLLSGGDDDALRLWDAQTGAQIGEPLRGHEDEVTSVAFSPDGTRLLSGSDDRTLRLWDAQTGAQIGEPLRGHQGRVRSVAFSPDGQRLLSGGRDGTLRLWDARTGAQIGAPLRGHEGVVTSVAFSPDGQRLLSGGNDGTLRLWDAQTGAQIGEPLRGHEGVVRSVAFSPDGQRLLSGGGDGTLRRWSVPQHRSNLFQEACRRIPFVNGVRDLSTDAIAEVIGVSGLTLPEDCDTYDPPLPEGSPGWTP